MAGVIDTQEHYGVVPPKGSPLEAAVNAAIGTLIANGRISILSRRRLAGDMTKLPSLP